MKRLLLVLILGSTACGGVDSSAPPTVSMDTLANGAVRVTNTGPGLWETEGAWHLQPELVLGEAEGPDALLFGSIAGLEAGDDGRIYVLDRQANELRIFSADGIPLRTVGRAGSGPGEYEAANGLLWIASDTLLVVDQSGGRYSVLTRDGDYVRSVPRRLGFFALRFDGGYADGAIYERTIIGRNYPDVAPAFIRVDLGGNAPPDTFMLPFPAAGPVPATFVMTTDQGIPAGYMAVPFSPGPVYYLDGDATLWYGHGGEFRIVHTSLDGDTLMEVTLDVAPDPVGPEELAAWEAQDYVKAWVARAGPIDMDRIPRVKPFFDELYADGDGYLWASVPADAGSSAFRIFDPRGRYLGRLAVPGVERVDGVRPVVRAGRLYLAGRDGLGVQRVYVFTIER